MKEKDLKRGIVYKDKSGLGEWWLNKVIEDGDAKLGYILEIEGPLFTDDSGDNDLDLKSAIIASSAETKWFEACEKAGKYIPFEDVIKIEQYAIY